MSLSSIRRVRVTTALATPLAAKADKDLVVAIDARVDTIEASLPDKASASSVTALDGRVDTVEAGLASKAEAAAVVEGLDDLQDNLNAEAATRAVTDTALQNDVNSRMGRFSLGGGDYGWNANTKRLLSVADPIASDDASTKSYTDNASGTARAEAINYTQEALADTALASFSAPMIVAAQPAPFGDFVSYTANNRMLAIWAVPSGSFAFAFACFELNGLGKVDGSGWRATQLRLRVFARPGGDGDLQPDPGNLILPGNGDNDVPVLDQIYATEDVALQPGDISTLVPVKFDLSAADPILRIPNYFYCFVINAYDDSDTLVTIGWRSYALGFSPPGTEDWRLGFASTANDDLTPPGASAYVLANSVAYQIYGGSRQAEGALSRPANRTVEGSVALLSPSPSIAVPSLRIYAPGLDAIVGGGTATFTPLPIESVVDTIILKAGQPTSLAYRYAQAAPLVKRGSTTLVRDTHYRYDPNRGTLTGLSGFASGGGSEDTSVTATYVGVDFRYDAIYADPEQVNIFGIQDGTPHRQIAEEFPATMPPTRTPMFMARVSVKGVELLPVHKTTRDRRWVIGEESIHLARLERNRRAIRKTIARAQTGQSVKIAGYGDSITAIGYNLSAQNTTPNGPARDIDAFLERRTSGEKAALAHFNGDGGTGAHIHVGPMWRLKAALEAWGSAVTYDNWGVGGTNSRSDSFVSPFDGVTYLHMGNPTRLAALIASTPNLIVLATGENELGELYTDNNVIDIGQQIMAAGIDLVVVAPTTPGNYHFANNQAEYLYTCSQLERAADALGCAFVPTHDVFTRLPLFGLSPEDASSASLVNHPEVAEFKLLGDLYADLVP